MSKKEFIIQALKDFKTIGSPIPSQKFLINKMTRQINPKSCKCIVELGAGDGCITRELEKKINKNCKIISFEINKNLAGNLQSDNKNLIVINDDATNLQKYMHKYGIKKIDYVISSLPLAQIKKDKAVKLISLVRNSLKKNGLYIQYQYSLISLKKIKSVFKKVSISFTPLNFPPAFVYTCTK